MRNAQWFTSQLRQTYRRTMGPRPGPIGIEFRDGFVRMVQVARDRRMHVLASACVAHVPGHAEWAIEGVLHALRGGGFIGTSCVLVLPFHAARVETLTMPEASDVDLKQAIDRDVSRRFGMDQPVCGFFRLGALPHDRCELAVVAADRGLVEGLVHPFIDEGFFPETVEPSFCAVARGSSRLFRRASDRGRVRIVVDCHRDGATAMLLQGQSIVHTAQATSRAAITNAVSTCWHEGRRLFAGAPSDDALHSEPTEVRLVGTDAYDPRLSGDIADACGLPVRHDDEGGLLAAAYTEIGVHATDAGGAAAWCGALGAAFHARSSAAETDHAPSRAGDVTQTREAA